MTQENITTVMNKYRNQIPPESVSDAIKGLNLLPDSCVMDILYLPIRYKGLMVLLSLFLGSFGVDRFVLGDTKIAVLKLVLTIASIPLFFLSIVSEFFLIVSWILAIVRGIINIVELFAVYRDTRLANYATLDTYCYRHVSNHA